MRFKARASQQAVLRGVVVPGHGRGHLLGFPTANIVLSADTRPPREGVYSCWVSVPPDPRTYGGTLSIGDNPTFADVEGRRVEAYLHDFHGDLYGHRIQVLLAARLRPMRRFATVSELIAQTAVDVQRSRRLLGQTTPPAFG